jgi:predicted nucleotidyltransferase
MIQLIQQHRQALVGLCQKHSVLRLELFGSAAAGVFDAQSSDLDFLVEFKSLEPGHAADAYFGLLFDLQTLFGRSIDLLMPNAIKNSYLLQSINQHRELLYAA